MHRWKIILIAFLATLAATFTIELPFTQVNYIHQLVNKKRITNTPKDTHRLHKTYYEFPTDMLLTAFIHLAAPIGIPLIHTTALTPGHPLTTSAGHPNVLRGPPSLA